MKEQPVKSYEINKERGNNMKILVITKYITCLLNIIHNHVLVHCYMDCHGSSVVTFRKVKYSGSYRSADDHPLIMIVYKT